ncbi:MAG: VanZ family protein [Schleiferiaceae bacterium]
MQKILQQRWFWLMLALIWAGIVLFYSLQPSQKLPGIFRMVQDLVLHFGAYAGIAVPLQLYSRSSAGPFKVFALSFSYGLAVEVLQPIVAEGRVFSWSDVAANTAGIAVGMLLARLIRKRIFNPKLDES